MTCRNSSSAAGGRPADGDTAGVLAEHVRILTGGVSDAKATLISITSASGRLHQIPGEPAPTVPQRLEPTRSAVAVFKRLLYLLAEHQKLFLAELTPVWTAFEREIADQLLSVVEAARVPIRAGRRELARDL